MSDKLLTIATATYDDFDGVFMTLQSLRLHHGRALNRCELLVLDNHPVGPHHQLLVRGRDGRRGLAAQTGATLLTLSNKTGTSCRDLLFRHATTPFVLCLDSHVMLAPGALHGLLDYLERNPETDDLIHGPLLGDRMKGGELVVQATHMEPKWGSLMFGRWGRDPRGVSASGPAFEIPMHGLGLFCARRESWLGFNPHFRGFGGEEGYIHAKYKNAGRRSICLPRLRWLHRFMRVGGAPYRPDIRDRIWNYLIGWLEIGRAPEEVAEAFAGHISAMEFSRMLAEAREALQGRTPPLRPAVRVAYAPPGPKTVAAADDPAYSFWHPPQAEQPVELKPAPVVVDEPAPELPPVGPRRPIVVLGVGHSGTSVLVRQLLSLGWHAPPLDEFAEPPKIREFNMDLMRQPNTATSTHDTRLVAKATQLLNELPEGYVIKDPRFVLTLHFWWDRIFSELPPSQQPLLVWIRRDFQEVAQSYRRRDYYVKRGDQKVLGLYGRSLNELYEMAARQYDQWEGDKLMVDMAQIERAIKHFHWGQATRSRRELAKQKEANG